MNRTRPLSATNATVKERLSRLPRPALWVIAARAKTLALSVMPVLAGTWMAAQSGGWSPAVALAALIAAVAIQIGTNLWNDAADAARGVDGPDRLGPPRMTALGLLDATRVRQVAAGSFLLAAFLGLWLAYVGGWPILAIGAVSLALGYFYSMGPRPLSATALGELLVVAFFGVVAVAGTVYLHGQRVGGEVLGLGLITGLPAAAVLLLNNHRDRHTDTRAGRRTLAILIGENTSQGLYALLLLAALAGGVLLGSGCLWGLTAFLPALALCLILVRAMIRMPVSAALNRLISGTAGFQFLLLAGIAASWAICG